MAFLALAVVYGFVVVRWGFQLLVPLVYAAASVLTFVVYGIDKSAAKSGGRRVPESTLHLLGLFGGWPGALVAQQTLRHKTSKQSFQLQFWATVGLNLAALVAWHAAGSFGGF